MKTILITGINGFLGSALAKTLIKDYNIVGLENSLHNNDRLKDIRLKLYDSHNQSLEDIFRINRIDYVIHTATIYRSINNTITDLVQTNISLPIRLFELVQEYGSEAFINTDSFFNDIRNSYNYLNNYTLSKRHCLEWLKNLNREHKLINMKLFHMYGPGDSQMKFVMQMMTDLKNNKPKIELTPGEQKRDFIYIDDVVNAFQTVINNIERINTGTIEYQVGTGHAITLKQFVKTAAEVTNSNSSLLFGALKYREGELMASEADTRNLKELNWHPTVTLEQGLQSFCK